MTNLLPIPLSDYKCFNCNKDIVRDFLVTKHNGKDFPFCSLICVESARIAGKVLPDPIKQYPAGYIQEKKEVKKV